MFKLNHLYFSILLRILRLRIAKKELIANVFLVLFLVMAFPSAGDQREVGPLAGPQAVISPYHFTDPEYGYGIDSWEDILFFNPTGIRVPTAEGEKFLMFVQTERSVLSHPDAHEGKQIQWTCGDKVVLFEADWSYEGLRTEFRVKKTISPCWCDIRETCPEGCRCTDEQLSSFGTGSVIKSKHDGKYYIFLDRSLGPNPTEVNGDFADVWIFVSEDGYDWDDTPLVNPLVQKSTVSGVPIQIWDVTLAAGDGKWWGFFQWYWPPNPPNYRCGMMQVIMDELNTRGFRVEILSEGVWKVVSDDGLFDFIPDNTLCAHSIVEEEKEGVTTYEAWTHGYPNGVTVGCTNGPDPGSPGTNISLFQMNEYGRPIVGSSTVLETLLEPEWPNPTANRSGKLFPFVTRDTEGDKLLYYSSTEQPCKSQTGWPPARGDWFGMEIVMTYLSDSVVQDRFSTWSERPVGFPLLGTATEIGELAWVGSITDLILADDYLTIASEGVTQIAHVPVAISEELPILTVEADVTLSATGWVNVNFASTATEWLGTLWMSISTVTGDVSVGMGSLSDDCELHSESAGDLTADHRLQLSFDSTSSKVSAWFDGNPILEALSIAAPSLGAGCENPPSWTNMDFKYAGFTIQNPSSDVKVDNFAVTEYFPPPLFSDDFESGDLSKWSESIP